MIYAATKAGRCANGNERDHGHVVHLLERDIPVSLNDWVIGPALCGTSPGRRSGGWSISPSGTAATCQRCLRRSAPHNNDVKLGGGDNG